VNPQSLGRKSRAAFGATLYRESVLFCATYSAMWITGPSHSLCGSYSVNVVQGSV